MALGSFKTTMLGRIIKLGPCFRWRRARYLCGFPRRLARRNPYSDHQPNNFGVIAVSCSLVALPSFAVERVKVESTASVMIVSLDGLVNSKTGHVDIPSPRIDFDPLRFEDTGERC